MQRIPGLRVLPGLCVAATREVRSVLLVSKVRPEQIRRLALDENSRTSVALVQISCTDSTASSPSASSPPPGRRMMEQADAALVIGDPALRSIVEAYRFSTWQPNGGS